MDGTSSNGRKRVLYIEGEAPDRDLMAVLLSRQEEIELITAPSGERGLEMALAEPPDLILLDPNLPDIPGEKVVERLRAGEATREIPVVVVFWPDRLEDSGVPAESIAAYVRKPIEDVAGFEEVVRASLAR